ncbi:MAG: alpha/beta hydrolase-fold protein [Thalassotalea sp.]|nr:alpha/beta hydrolase-fold protein [Thalassotalea sp.]
MRLIILLILMVFNPAIYATSIASSSLTDNQSLESRILAYALQYRVYLPNGYDESKRYPVIYFTDGQWFLSADDVVSVLDTQVESSQIMPVIAVFVDSLNPDKPKQNRRNKQFMCNRDYLQFFVNELVPEVSGKYSASLDRRQRIIEGLSFGGLNAAGFGVMASDVFGGIAMLSHASNQHLKLVSDIYETSKEVELAVFLSGGKCNDNLRAIRKFHKVLKRKGHEINYHEVPFGHNWKNWQPLLDDVLQTFFKLPE